MSGANNIPLGRPGGQGGQLAQAASSLGGISLLNPSYLSGGAGPDPNERAASSSSSGRRSKFGPPVAGKKILKWLKSLDVFCLIRDYYIQMDVTLKNTFIKTRPTFKL